MLQQWRELTVKQLMIIRKIQSFTRRTCLGIVGAVENGLARIEQRNKFSVGETIEIMKPDGSNVEAKVLRILNEDGEEQESAPHSKQVLHVELSETPAQYDLLRRQEEDKEVNS